MTTSRPAVPTHGPADELAHLIERVLQLPGRPDSWWDRAGVSPRAEQWLGGISWVVLGALALAWLWCIVGLVPAGTSTPAIPATRAVAAALTNTDVPSTAYLTEAALEAFTPLRGASGKVRVVLRAPGESVPSALPPGAAITYAGRGTALQVPPRRSGIWQLAVKIGEAVRPVANLSVITLTPLAERQEGRIGLYYIGRWPTENRRASASGALTRADYSPPRGFIEVTPQNEDTPLSEHFKLRDFLTHDQQNVWPKYVVVQTRLIDKLELVLADLAEHGIPAAGVHVMSGFRTPQYNAGGGDPNGRAGLSRHMYGDAADIWIDNAGRGKMDDLNHDGRTDVRDAEVIRAAVDRVEQAHPELVGGVGVYSGNGAHGPFTHIDARGYRARWTGRGDG